MVQSAPEANLVADPGGNPDEYSMALTVKRVERLNGNGRYADSGGLYLQIKGPANRSWLFRYQKNVRDEAGQTLLKPNGRPKIKECWLGLGSVETYDLTEAREKARQMRKLLTEGGDPLADKIKVRSAKIAEAAKTITFKEAAKAYHKANGDLWRNDKHRAQFLSTLETYVFPLIGDMAVADVTKADVIRIFDRPVAGEKEPFWQSRSETARRVRQRTEVVFRWARSRGYRAGENPASWEGLKDALPGLGKVERTSHAALRYASLAAFWRALAGREGISAKALQFTILTAARTGETIGAVWDEFDLEAGLWRIPAGRMKAGGEHVVPLGTEALDILGAVPREKDNPHVFIGSKAGKGISNMSMAKVLKAMGRDDLTVHGFRSTFKDWAAETTSYPNIVSEMALAHTITSKVEASYRRGDLLDWRKRLMKDWANYCINGKPANDENVVGIRQNAI